MKVEAGDAFLGDVMGEMRPVIRDQLLYFWSKGIRGADFFISAIGPALSVFGRYSAGDAPRRQRQVTVREFLDMVRRESTTVALEQVLHGADLGILDPVTRQYVTWAWSYSKTPLDAGEAIALCLATGASYDDTTRPHSITAEKRQKSKKVVQLRSIRQRAMEDDDLDYGTAARPCAPYRSASIRRLALGPEPSQRPSHVHEQARRGPLDRPAHPRPSRSRVPPGRRRRPSHHPRLAGKQRDGVDPRQRTASAASGSGRSATPRLRGRPSP